MITLKWLDEEKSYDPNMSSGPIDLESDFEIFNHQFSWLRMCMDFVENNPGMTFVMNYSENGYVAMVVGEDGQPVTPINIVD